MHFNLPVAITIFKSSYPNILSYGTELVCDIQPLQVYNNHSHLEMMPSLGRRWQILFQRHRIFCRPIFSTADRDRRALRVEKTTAIFEYLEQVNEDQSLT